MSVRAQPGVQQTRLTAASPAARTPAWMASARLGKLPTRCHVSVLGQYRDSCQRLVTLSTRAVSGMFGDRRVPYLLSSVRICS
jgi:hypothetical protein